MQRKRAVLPYISARIRHGQHVAVHVAVVRQHVSADRIRRVVLPDRIRVRGGDRGVIVIARKIRLREVMQPVQSDDHLRLGGIAVDIHIDKGIPARLLEPRAVRRGCLSTPIETGIAKHRPQVYVIRTADKIGNDIHARGGGIGYGGIGKHIIAITAAQGVGACAALDDVVATFAIDGVVAVAAIDHIIAAHRSIVAIVPIDQVIAVAAIDAVIARLQRFMAAAEQEVRVGIEAVSIQRVATVVCAGRCCAIARAANHVVAAASIDRIDPIATQ